MWGRRVGRAKCARWHPSVDGTGAHSDDDTAVPAYEDISEPEPDIVIAVSSDSEWDTVEPDDPPTVPEPVLPQVRAVRVGSKPLELQKQLLQHVLHDELVEASTSTLAPTSRVVKDVVERHLLNGRRR